MCRCNAVVYRLFVIYLANAIVLFFSLGKIVIPFMKYENLNAVNVLCLSREAS